LIVPKRCSYPNPLIGKEKAIRQLTDSLSSWAPLKDKRGRSKEECFNLECDYQEKKRLNFVSNCRRFNF